MKISVLLLFLLAGCAREFRACDQPYIMPQVHNAAAQAFADCGGPWQSWSRTTTTSRWPYRIETTETMRCLNDGRVVGPHTYREDGL